MVSIHRSIDQVGPYQLQYFEPGHKFMSADSFHDLVEKKMNLLKNVYDFNDFIQVINYAGKALQMNFSDFVKYPRCLSIGKWASNVSRLGNISVVKFFKGSKCIFWKDDFNEPIFKSS